MSSESDQTIIRLHLPAIPHTITRNEFSHCAFTGKVLRFPSMMIKQGYEVYHYGVETSEPNATVNIDILQKDEWNKLRIQSYKTLKNLNDVSDEEVLQLLENNKKFVGDLANINTILYKTFNVKFREALIKNYRSSKTDIICLPYGKSHDLALENLDVVSVESGIGHPDSYRNYRIFESYAWLHYTIGKEKINCPNYFFVAPIYYNVLEFPLSLKPEKNKIGFFGRICDVKGLCVIVDIAKRFPDVEFVICGQGDPNKYLTEPNIKYKEPIHSSERGEFLGSLTGMIAPSLYVEPFCSSAVEAQLTGCPVICFANGAFLETVENFKTGLHCHTLQDFCYGVQMCLDNKFDRQYIGDRSRKLYDMYNVSKQYDYIFRNIMDIHNGSNGWYSKNTYIEKLL